MSNNKEEIIEWLLERKGYLKEGADRLAKKLQEVGNNFSNINLSLKPVDKNSQEDIKKNNVNHNISNI